MIATFRFRSLLYVPGDRADRIAKAHAASVDSIAVDLEDAVSASNKAEARAIASESIVKLGQSGPVIGVRVNGIESGLAEDDFISLSAVLPNLGFVILPMASSADHVAAASAFLDQAETRAGLKTGRTALIPLLENAEGIFSSLDIGRSSSRIPLLAFGPADLCGQLGVTPTAEGTELLAARSQIVLASAAAGLDKPLDGPHLNIDDDEGLRESTVRAQALGFGGKQAIHPRQLSTISEVFQPSSRELEWAREVDAAFTDAERRGLSSIRLDDGTFVDYPIAHRARGILRDAAR